MAITIILTLNNLNVCVVEYDFGIHAFSIFIWPESIFLLSPSNFNYITNNDFNHITNNNTTTST